MCADAIMLLIGGAAYKLGQNSVKQVEHHAGISAAQLTEQELQTAMAELRDAGIISEADLEATKKQLLGL